MSDDGNLLAPEAELLKAMAAFGLRPPTPLKWNGKFVRFPGTNARRQGDTAGYYRAFPDQRGAHFGCHRGNIDEHWVLRSNGAPQQGFSSEEWAANQARWAAEAKEREAVREREWLSVAAKCEKRFLAAAEPSPSHPYLVKKGIVAAVGIKQEGEALLVPMKGPIPGTGISSLQLIQEDGEKRFAPGGRTKGTRATILSANRPLPEAEALYICEGWATGWTIHHVTGDPVLVAFSAGNLEEIAAYVVKQYADQYPLLKFIIAADNDRWSQGNPGVKAAQFAAKVAGPRMAVAIPDFSSVGGKPTDFNDLWLLDGPDAVLRWLDPKNAAAALITPEAPAPPPPPVHEPEPDEEDEEEEEDDPDDYGPAIEPVAGWMDGAPFRPIGYDHGTYFYLSRGTGQIHTIPDASHRKERLIGLAPLPWWEQTFPAKTGANWLVATNALFRASERVGVFRPERVRGRGCWMENDGILIHLGDRLLPAAAKAWVNPEDYESPGRHIYERHPALKGPSPERALPLEEAADLLDLMRSALWMEDASGILMAGWTVLAPLCGSLEWRPHVWVIGDAGAGKSTLLRSLIVPLLGGMRIYLEGNTSEAGIRQRLGSDGLPVIFDEAEQQDQRSDDRVQAVLQLARSASSSEGAEVVKGTTHGRAMSFQVRSMFCLASIGGALRQEADKSRVSLLQLHGAGSVSPEQRRAHWARFQPRLAGITEEKGRQLVSRSLQWLRDGRLAETIRTFRKAAAIGLKDQRAGDQYGTLYGGAWLLMSDEPPSETEATELISGESLGDYVQEQVPAGRKVLQKLLQVRERIDTKEGPKTVAVGQLVDCVTGNSLVVSEPEANAFLRQVGLRVEMHKGYWRLLLANNSDWVKDNLMDTPYSDSPYAVLRTLPGVEPGPVTRFHAGLTSRVTIIPMRHLDAGKDPADVAV